MKTTKLIACLLLAASPCFLTGCLAVAKSLATGNAVKSATLGQQPGMVEVAQKSTEAAKIMSANTSAQGEAIRYIDNPVDDHHSQAADPLGSDRARLDTLKENLQYLQGLRNKPSHKGDKDLDRRIASIQGQIRGIYINNGQKPPADTAAINDAARDAARDTMHSTNNSLMGGNGSHIQNAAPVMPAHTH